MTDILIIDDESHCRSYLRSLLVSSGIEFNSLKEAEDIDEAKRLIEEHSPQLVFLDVEMPGGNGFDLLSSMEQWPFEVVFTTGYERYAIQAIRFSALDYLLKPVQPKELKAALNAFQERKNSVQQRHSVQQQFIQNLRQGNEQGFRLTLTQGDHTYFIPPNEIKYCLASSNYTELFLDDGRRFVSARTLKEYEEMLEPWGFLRIHRSSLVSRTSIQEVEDKEVILTGGDRLEISRRRRTEVLKMLSK